MRITPVLLQQHVGRMFRFHWKISSNKKLVDDGALDVLKQRGVPVVNALDFIKEINPRPHIIFPGLENFKAVEVIPHLSFNDSNVLVCGLAQAKVFTNSIEVRPESLNFVNVESDFSRHDLVKRSIRSSLMFDAQQVKLPKRRDPERPAWNFPRDYGICDRRKNLLLCNRMIQLCSSLNPQLLAHRRVTSDAHFSVPVIRDGENVLLNLRADILLTSSEGIEPPSIGVDIEQNSVDKDLPSLTPLLPTVSLIKETSPIDQFKNSFPLDGSFVKSNIHTVIVHFNPTETANIHDCDVTRDQFLSRSLMKAYTFALAEARRLYGIEVASLPRPVTVQCVHTDSKYFHFSVLQLNTALDSTQTDVRNFYWSLPVETLFESCDFEAGKPVLRGYNGKVFSTLLAFYRNCY